MLTLRRKARDAMERVNEVRLGDGEVAVVGDEVTLLPDFESLCDHPTYGVIRTLEGVKDHEGWALVKVGVLWYGHGGLWVRHYVAEQLGTASFAVAAGGPTAATKQEGVAASKRRQSKWEVVGKPADEAETTKRTWEGDTSRPIIQRILSDADLQDGRFNPQDVLVKVLEALENEPGSRSIDEQLVRDVLAEEIAYFTIAQQQQSNGLEGGFKHFQDLDDEDPT